MSEQANNPLHGIRLDAILNSLLEYYGSWEAIGQVVPVKCFTVNPSLKSALVFLRKTDWARQKVEQLYIKHIAK